MTFHNLFIYVFLYNVVLCNALYCNITSVNDDFYIKYMYGSYRNVSSKLFTNVTNDVVIDVRELYRCNILNTTACHDLHYNNQWYKYPVQFHPGCKYYPSKCNPFLLNNIKGSCYNVNCLYVNFTEIWNVDTKFNIVVDEIIPKCTNELLLYNVIIQGITGKLNVPHKLFIHVIENGKIKILIDNNGTIVPLRPAPSYTTGTYISPLSKSNIPIVAYLYFNKSDTTSCSTIAYYILGFERKKENIRFFKNLIIKENNTIIFNKTNYKEKDYPYSLFNKSGLTFYFDGIEMENSVHFSSLTGASIPFSNFQKKILHSYGYEVLQNTCDVFINAPVNDTMLHTAFDTTTPAISVVNSEIDVYLLIIMVLVLVIICLTILCYYYKNHRRYYYFPREIPI